MKRTGSESPPMLTRDGSIRRQKMTCKIMCGNEELSQPEFIDGVDMDDIGDVIEAASDARERMSLDVDVDVWQDGKLIGTWTSEGWQPVTMARIVEWQAEILYSHSGNPGTARNADGAREYAERGDHDADVISDSMTHDEAVDAIKEYKCEIRRCRFHVGSGWCAYVKYAEEYEINSAGDSVPLSGIGFAEWERPEEEQDNG